MIGCGRCFRVSPPVIVAVACLLQLSSAYGAKWSFDPSVTVSETYTDNVTLESAANAESDWVTQITPGFSLTGDGKNLSLSLSYNLQNLFYASDASRNNSYQQLQSELNAALLPRYLFIDATTSISQQVLNSSDKVSTSNIAAIGNRTDVQSSSVSPYFRTRLGGELETELRYTYDSVTYSKSNSQNSISDGISVDLSPAHNTGSWSWDLNYQQRNIDYRNSPDEKRENTSANISYQIDSHLIVVGTGGYQNDKYVSSTNTPRGGYWNLDVNWNPSSRTELTFGGGERYYGRSWNLNFAHQGRRNDWSLSYSESPSSQRLLQLESETNSTVGSQSLQNNGSLVTFDQVFISKQANASWGIRLRKIELNAAIYNELREYQDNGFEDRIEGSSLAGLWKMSRQNQFLVVISWQNTQGQITNDNYQIFTASYRRQIMRQVTGDINFDRLQRTGSSTNDYTENRISAVLNMSW